MSRPENGDEVELLARIASQDKQALGVLYRRYYSKLMQFCLRMVRTAEDAEEIVNDVFMVLWRDAGKFEGRSRVSTWLMGIAYRRALKQLRSQSNYLRLVAKPAKDGDDADAMLQNAADDGPALAESVAHEDSARVALRALPPDQRLMVELALVMGHSYPEIAEIADCPVNTVKTRIFHARKRMRDALASAGVGKELADVLGTQS